MTLASDEAAASRRAFSEILAGLATVVESYGVAVDTGVNPPLSDWEAEWLLWGFRANVFGFKVPSNRGHHTAAFSGKLFEHETGGIAVNVFQTPKAGRRTVAREQLTTMAAVAKLTGHWKHDARAIRLESRKQANGSQDSYGVDIEVFGGRSLRGSPILAVEAKKDGSEGTVLIAGVRACRGIQLDANGHVEAYIRAYGSRPVGNAKNHHQKCRYLATRAVGTLWVVSPSADSEVYRVEGAGAPGFTIERDPSNDLSRDACRRRAL